MITARSLLWFALAGLVMLVGLVAVLGLPLLWALVIVIVLVPWAAASSRLPDNLRSR